MNTENITGSAIFSSDGRYRYVLRREWNAHSPGVLFIGLNPSTADASRNDPTIRRLIGFAHRWGYGHLVVANLYAYCTPYPGTLFQCAEPVGKENDRWLSHLVKQYKTTVLIYGNQARKGDRHLVLLPMVPQPYCIRISKAGMPMHPLYLPYTSEPIPF